MAFNAWLIFISCEGTQVYFSVVARKHVFLYIEEAVQISILI